jgi:hypothetical protein
MEVVMREMINFALGILLILVIFGAIFGVMFGIMFVAREFYSTCGC